MPAQVLTLPADFTIPEKRSKRVPQPVDFDVFTEQQRVAADLAIDYVAGKTPYRMLVIRGYAGTGKTFTIGRLQDYFLYAKKLKVVISCPTNKAVQVVKDLCDIADPNLTFSTIHKLLGLKEHYDLNGRLSFKPDPQNPPALSAYDVLIIDETSMLDDSLFKLIEPFIEEGLKIIFVGDPAQIPPINRLDCIPFLKQRQREYGIGVADLTKIMRQGEDNPLLDFATQIREQRKNQHFVYDYRVMYKDGMGIFPIKKTAKDVIYQICDTYFANDIFAQYPDFMKVISWRNDAVNAVNRKVRKLIYKKEELPMLMPGEKLIANNPIKTQEQSYLTNNSEFMVVGYDIGSTKYNGVIKNDVIVREEFKYYHTQVETMTDKGLRRYHIWIIHEDSLTAYNHSVEALKNHTQRLSGYDRIEGWRAYYTLKNYFADVKYNYAITAHKAQGSSYENVMILEWDINDCFKPEERNRIKYVAATRARKQLFVIQ